ncbi:PREDICTED: uncharacterized protein LOC109176597 [Ipomoea nil]|uniref:uncharacterized protein LOC109176597 n=1 Tax=Ipomoea nil TaxID=35883 RepID=UPI0009015146|nr:PREDICTED: uncharacterized protein LOC109176597 [Ipomoea nil]
MEISKRKERLRHACYQCVRKIHICQMFPSQLHYPLGMGTEMSELYNGLFNYPPQKLLPHQYMQRSVFSCIISDCCEFYQTKSQNYEIGVFSLHARKLVSVSPVRIELSELFDMLVVVEYGLCIYMQRFNPLFESAIVDHPCFEKTICFKEKLISALAMSHISDTERVDEGQQCGNVQKRCFDNMSKQERRNLRRRLAANTLAVEKEKKTSQTKSHCSVPIRSVRVNDFENHPFKLSVVSDCTCCGAKRIQYEPPGFCCRGGQIKLVSNAMPCVLKNLFIGRDDASKHFRNYVRTYNNTFAFTSLGIHNHDKDLCRRNKGIYTFRVQGQMYHLIDDLIPHGHSPRNLQLYFFDTETEVDNRVGYVDRLDRSIVSDLVELMSQNPYAQFFRSLKDVNFGDDFVISLNSTTSLDQRVYNLPTASQVAAIWLENDSDRVPANRSIKVYACSGCSHSVQYYYGCYDPLQYPLLFPFGQTGWHEGIERNFDLSCNKVRKQHQSCIIDPTIVSSVEELIAVEESIVSEGKKKRYVSCRESYAYKFQVRPNDHSLLLHTGRLLQQFIVDIYIKIENERLDYYRTQQDQSRIETYQGLVDSVCVGATIGDDVGRRIILPVSFIGRPRDMKRRYMDAMSLVQRFGKPDLFLTMTCNPNWPEIKELLYYNDEAQNRPDLLARVFRARFEEMKDDILKKKIFGEVAAYTYVIEFQKRGLPHAHFLLILRGSHKITSPNQCDKIVSAEIPDKRVDPYLHSLVARHMIHGPLLGDDSYPIYRRRPTIKTVFVRGHELDNRWVVPYNRYLLEKFDCHVNLEICAGIKCVKYIYKYIYKGHDRVSIRLCGNNVVDEYDEIKEFQNARWVSPPEAAWRIFSFNLAEMKLSVVHLQVHLPNYQYIKFNKYEKSVSIVDEKNGEQDYRSRTMLTQFFYMNKVDELAKQLNLLYLEFPEFFVWSLNDKRWHQRKQREVIGRLVSVMPSEGERYYLRLLLMNVRAPTSFCSLKIIKGQRVETFREAAEKLGLLSSDSSIESSIEEAILCQMPTSLRQLFATLLVFCDLPDPVRFWNKYKEFFCQDFIHSAKYTESAAEIKALQLVKNLLEKNGRKITDFNLVDPDIYLSDSQRQYKEIEAERNLGVNDHDLHCIDKLNNMQRLAFDKIMTAVHSDFGGVFFLDGPGGTGKTFLYRCLLAKVRSHGWIALATASSGIAASILPGGRTAHSRFKIPIDGDNRYVCNVSKQSAEAELLRHSKLILWDEASMANRRCVESLEVTLRDLMNSDDTFGGKVVVFGGDFRQTLPVIRGGKREDFIEASLVKSPSIWPKIQHLRLDENMRARSDPGFSDYLMRIGNGTEPTLSTQNNFFNDPYSLMTRALLTSKNEFVDDINSTLIDKFPGVSRCYVSYDEPLDSTKYLHCEDYLHTLSPSGMPPHKLILKKNCPIILLRNLNPSEGLCNGTRLICEELRDFVISCYIAIGEHKGNHVFIPRIPLQISKDDSCPIPFKRHQFPIRVCFAMTINKAQGQTLDFVGIYLREPVFSHGQLYVAMSRARKSDSVKLIIHSEDDENQTTNITDNIVYPEILQCIQTGIDTSSHK